jgi:hypothetical protein
LTFIHHDPEFPGLLRIVAEARGIVAPLIEKDYWVTHTIWALQNAGLEAQDMLIARQIRKVPSPADPAFRPSQDSI